MSLWNRKPWGWYYRTSFRWNDGVVTRSLGFATYHLIRMIHGQDTLDEMATKPPKLNR